MDLALTDKQERFCQEYMVDLNAKQAAIRAGYSGKTAESIGYQLLQKTTVSKRIAQLQAVQSRRTGINADRVLRELAKVAFADIGNVVDDTGALRQDITEEDRAAIASIKVKSSETDSGSSEEREIKLYDKLRALDLIGRHLGMFQDKLEISPNTGQLEGILAQLKGSKDG